MKSLSWKFELNRTRNRFFKIKQNLGKKFLNALYYPGQKKKNHHRDSRREERCFTCGIRRDQRRAKVADSRGSDLPCADRVWSSMISHVEQRSSRRESRWWFFFLSRVVYVVSWSFVIPFRRLNTCTNRDTRAHTYTHTHTHARTHTHTWNANEQLFVNN